MELFGRLLFGHLLADFTFQTNYIAHWKRLRMKWLLIHVGIHPLCYYTLVYPFLSDIWFKAGPIVLNGWASIPILTGLHFLEDWFRVKKVNQGWPDNTAFYSWDQFIHVLFLWIFTNAHHQPLQQLWPILGSLMVIVTHCATVTVWFIEKDIYGSNYPETEEKYISILQRLVVWLAFFMPDPWWVFVLGFVLVSFGRHVWTRRIDFSWTSVILGNVIAILCGVVTRFGLRYHF